MSTESVVMFLRHNRKIVSPYTRAAHKLTGWEKRV
jgi:hypothetical protein